MEETSSANLLNEYFSLNQLAKELHRSVRTIQRWETMRMGPPRIKIGNLVLYPKSKLRVWLESQTDERPSRQH